ncbi:MAG: hypothetical protein EXX96DRAFT_573291 [Benjaminiella poitrasii]|nr:MAG: hypothetical protein EXX96DRAFT_573291 [Benjaminiella poitrasii]
MSLEEDNEIISISALHTIPQNEGNQGTKRVQVNNSSQDDDLITVLPSINPDMNTFAIHAQPTECHDPLSPFNSNSANRDSSEAMRSPSAQTLLLVPKIEHRLHMTPIKIDTIRPPNANQPPDSAPSDNDNSTALIRYLKSTKLYQLLVNTFKSPSNRYAFQVSLAVTIVAFFIMFPPLSNLIPKAHWIGVAVVAVLDPTVGGMLTLSFQRAIGTLSGGFFSWLAFTSTRWLFLHDDWNWRCSIVLSLFMFCQVFGLAKWKLIPNMANTANCSLLTTVVFLLADHVELTEGGGFYAAKTGGLRLMNLLLGILLATLVSLFIFPLKASAVTRENLGKAFEEAAELYTKSCQFYLDLPPNTATVATQDAPHPRRRSSISTVIHHTFSTQDPERRCCNNNDTLDTISSQAFSILSKLQIESNRLDNISNEHYFQRKFQQCLLRREFSHRHTRRVERYKAVIEALQSIVWPLVSFRLLDPLVIKRRSLVPSADNVENFERSVKVMRLLAAIFRDHRRPLRDFGDQWPLIEGWVRSGCAHVTLELDRLVALHERPQDGLQLVSYYGFLTRSKAIWEGLEKVVDELGHSVYGNGSASVFREEMR